VKLFTAGIILIACVSAPAQNSVPSDGKAFSALDTSSNRILIWHAPNSTAGGAQVTSKAHRVSRGAADLVELRGNVEIKTPAALIQADEVDYHLSTGAMDLRGNVRLKPSTTN
jgi:lipopolysaccharide assembly outer membrane protein LptD (OstA)